MNMLVLSMCHKVKLVLDIDYDNTVPQLSLFLAAEVQRITLDRTLSVHRNYKNGTA